MSELELKLIISFTGLAFLFLTAALEKRPNLGLSISYVLGFLGCMLWVLFLLG